MGAKLITLIILLSRRQLALVDLDQPMESMRKFSRQSKWEVSAVQWNPQSSHRHIFASAVSWTQAAYITKEVSPSLAKLPWKFSGGLANLELISLEK